MTEKIFRSIFIVSLFALLCSILLIAAVLNSIFIKKVESDLESEALLAAHALELGGEELFSLLDTPNRITLIDESGVVLKDSERSPSDMGNHADREEFIEAQKYGVGKSIRHSDTIAAQTINYALRLSACGNLQ